MLPARTGSLEDSGDLQLTSFNLLGKVDHLGGEEKGDHAADAVGGTVSRTRQLEIENIDLRLKLESAWNRIEHLEKRMLKLMRRSSLSNMASINGNVDI